MSKLESVVPVEIARSECWGDQRKIMYANPTLFGGLWKRVTKKR